MRILSLLLALTACPRIDPLPDRLVRDPLPVIDGAHLDLPQASAVRLLRIEGLNAPQVRLEGQMIVVGAGFGDTPGKLLLGGSECQVQVWRFDRISAQVPRVATGIQELVLETARGERVVGLVVVYDAQGGLDVPIDIREVDTEAPMVRLPTVERLEIGKQELKAQVSDNVGVVVTSWTIDGQATAIGTTLQLDASQWPVGSRHTIEAKAEDASGNIGLDRREVTAEAAEPPTIALEAGISRNGHMPIRIQASDNVQVGRVDLLVDDQPIPYPVAVPLSFDWNTSDPERYADGSDHTLSARVWDAVGLSATAKPIAQIIRNSGGPTLRGLSTHPDPAVASGVGYPIRCVAQADDPDQDSDGLRYDWEVRNEAGAVVQTYRQGPRLLDVAMPQAGRYRVVLKRVSDRGGRFHDQTFTADLQFLTGNGRVEGGQ